MCVLFVYVCKHEFSLRVQSVRAFVCVCVCFKERERDESAFVVTSSSVFSKKGKGVRDPRSIGTKKQRHPTHLSYTEFTFLPPGVGRDTRPIRRNISVAT